MKVRESPRKVRRMPSKLRESLRQDYSRTFEDSFSPRKSTKVRNRTFRDRTFADFREKGF